MKMQLLRHATLILHIHGKKFLVDPMLSPKDTLDPVQNCGNDIRFPMVDLPISQSELLETVSEVDAVVVTHLHRDHWDAAAQDMISKNKRIYCQPSDREKLTAQGFTHVIPVDVRLDWDGISIHRTSGKHGTGEIGKKMGEVSGFVFEYGNKSIYLAGDTIWCDDVENSLTKFSPEVTIVNAGGARFMEGDAITMTPDDILQVRTKLPGSKIIAVHMDTVNHCFVTRAILSKVLNEKGLAHAIAIPLDGETIQID